MIGEPAIVLMADVRQECSWLSTRLRPGSGELIPATAPSAAPRTIVQDVGTLIHDALIRQRSAREWRVSTGRPYPGSYGIARSYEEAREALTLADRLRLDATVVDARDMLVYRVLVRDQAAIVDLARLLDWPGSEFPHRAEARS